MKTTLFAFAFGFLFAICFAHINQESNKIVELYEIRLAAAKLDLEEDQANLEHAKQTLDAYRNLSSKGACPDRLLTEAIAEVRYSKYNVKYSKLAIKEAEAQLDIVRNGAKAGKINIGDISLDLSPRQRRSK
jgi:multidrug resistance efflux pump